MTRRHVTARDFRDEPIDRPATWFAPGGPSGPSETYQRKGYVLRVRGDTAAVRERLGVEERRIPREFICPVHGRFTREVDEQTDEMACGVRMGPSLVDGAEVYCGLTSPWSPSSVGQGKGCGEVTG